MEGLAAVCGLYCGACGIYRAQRDGNQKRLEEIRLVVSGRRPLSLADLRCDGCLSGGNLMRWCQQCGIKRCSRNKPGVTRCSDCPDFPCPLVTAFNNDGYPHHVEALGNLRRQREIGVEAWLKEEEERWRCPQCRAPVEWYAKSCFRCGAAQPRRLPSLPRDQKSI